MNECNGKWTQCRAKWLELGDWYIQLLVFGFAVFSDFGYIPILVGAMKSLRVQVASTITKEETIDKCQLQEIDLSQFIPNMWLISTY